MIVWSEKLYIGERAEKNCGSLKKKLEKGTPLPNVFLITRPTNEKNLFDILPATELVFPYYKRTELFVCGLAKGRDEAEVLLLSMLEDVCRVTGGLCCKEYFESE